MMSNKYCLIGHHLSLELLLKNCPEFIGKPPAEIKQALITMPATKVTDLVGVKSTHNGKVIEGFGIAVNLLPEQFFELESELVINKIAEALELAKSLGAQMAVLGSATSIIGNQGVAVAKKVKGISITTGNSYTAASVIESISQLADRTKINLKYANVVIVGATGSIGAVCSNYFAEKARKLILIARNKNRLQKLTSLLSQKGGASVSFAVEEQIKGSIADADIVITATSAPYALIDAVDFKPFALVCDVAVPPNVSHHEGKQRENVLIIEGGIVRPPGQLKKPSFAIGYPTGTAPACLCEGMILTLEGRQDNFSLGKGLSIEKVAEISRLGKKHGFKLESFRSFGSILTQGRLNNFVSAKNG